MAFRDSMQQKLEALRLRLDVFNCSLAEKALPGDRKLRVSELSLQKKARDAGQKAEKFPQNI
ncbi:hypothetical protein [Marinobacter sp.]|uniref:hypothetical protein n=1 Tax=Marinobacter sp. TaxID=50741 RepID=UPI0034A160B6